MIDGKKVPFRLQQEDFAQALGVPASQKYEKIGDSYLKRAFTLLRQYSDNPVEDQLKLWDICIFNYLIGNTDNHIKNIGLLYGKDRRTIRLAPAYDIVSTMIYEESTEQMAMAIDGELDIRKITKESFAQRQGILDSERESQCGGLNKCRTLLNVHLHRRRKKYRMRDIRALRKSMRRF